MQLRLLPGARQRPHNRPGPARFAGSADRQRAPQPRRQTPAPSAAPTGRPSGGGSGAAWRRLHGHLPVLTCSQSATLGSAGRQRSAPHAAPRPHSPPASPPVCAAPCPGPTVPRQPQCLVGRAGARGRAGAEVWAPTAGEAGPARGGWLFQGPCEGFQIFQLRIPSPSIYARESL